MANFNASGNNDHHMVNNNVPSSSSFSGNPLASAPPRSATELPMRHNPRRISLEWTREEQHALEALLVRHAEEPVVTRYALIAMQLEKKSIRDVALRVRWMSRKENANFGKRRKDDVKLARESKDKKEATSSLFAAQPPIAVSSHFAAQPPSAMPSLFAARPHGVVPSHFAAPPPAARPSLFAARPHVAVPSQFAAQPPAARPSHFAAPPPAARPSLFAARPHVAVPSHFAAQPPAARPSHFAAPPPAARPSLFAARPHVAVPSHFAAQPPAARPSLFAAQPPTAVPSHIVARPPATMPSLFAARPNAYHLVPGMATMNIDDGISYCATEGVIKEQLEQNDQALRQISRNLASFQVQGCSKLFCQTRQNLTNIMNKLKGIDLMMQMPPLPLKLDEIPILPETESAPLGCGTQLTT